MQTILKAARALEAAQRNVDQYRAMISIDCLMDDEDVNGIAEYRRGLAPLMDAVNRAHAELERAERVT